MKENGDQKEELNEQLLISKEEEENLKSNKMSIGSKHSNSFVSQEMTIESLPDESNKYNKSIKVILLGDTNVGKSSIVNCLKQDESLQRKTISLEVYNYTIKIKSLVLRMQIWDTVGQEKFDSVATNYYKITDVAIFVYAINDINSFNNIENWLNALNDKGNGNENINAEESGDKNMIKILVGNKSDLNNERKVTYDMGEELRKEKGFHLFKEISCHFNGKNEAILDENNSEENLNENENLNIGQMNESNNEEGKDCVKNLFKEIVKILYKEYYEDQKTRFNSSVYYYEASNSILEIAPERSDSESGTKKIKKSKNKCCC
jgi:small GTP-binding protein